MAEWLYSGQRQPPREVTRTYPCPKCYALAGMPCQGRRGPRKSHHLERVEVALGLRPAEASPAPGSLPDGASGAAVKPPQAAHPAGVDGGEHASGCRETVAGAPR